MRVQIKYDIETKIVPFGDRTIKINNFTPILSPKEHEQRKREIEQQLFNIFHKYSQNTKKALK